MIQLVGIGGVPLQILDTLAAQLARQLRVSCRVRTDSVDPEFAFDPVRGQYHSTAILRHLASVASNGNHRILGVAAVDLFVPIFTFVFGEAQLSGSAALISTYRLRQELYGEPSDPDLVGERLLKEALHEIGHTAGLRHCQDWNCPMSATTAIERLDLKSAQYCKTCSGQVYRNLI